MRLDLYLYQNGLTKSRQKAKALIESGCVVINGATVTKPSFEIDEATEACVEVNDTCPYVSRGGLKLEHIIKNASISVAGCVCIDIGASTGGFTHCLLLNGAEKVFAVDSGTDQLDESLKFDNRVISLENFNARNMSLEDFGEMADIITIDVSFISQTLILPGACRLLKENGYYLSLIKPQFEAGKGNIGKNGIVKEAKARLMAVNRVIDSAYSCGLVCSYLSKSPIQGGDGNIEYVAVFSRQGNKLDDSTIKRIVSEK
jgi:23S rRNA (cytidine1920-2'-O)/16S rRNA (cytidine1409-2'-O)-methyltransferase